MQTLKLTKPHSLRSLSTLRIYPFPIKPTAASQINHDKQHNTRGANVGGSRHAKPSPILIIPQQSQSQTGM